MANEALLHARRVSTGELSSRTALIWFCRAAIVTALAASWQFFGQDEYWKSVFSSPSEVSQKFATWMADSRWWGHLAATLEEAALGYLLGVAVALVLVALITPNPLLGRFLAPYLAALNSLPKIALAPLFIFWFGTTLASKVYFVASLICFIIFHGIQTGLRTIDPAVRDNVRLLGASRLSMLMHLYIPAIFTWIISSLRLSSAFALLAAVIGEYLGSNKGLGYLIASAQQSMQPDAVIAGIISVAAIALLLDRSLHATEMRMSAWRAF